MSQAVPEKTTGTLCNKMVEAGLTAYPCTLAQNHFAENHEEPCYAVESARSVRAWRLWKTSRDAVEEVHVHRYEADDEADVATCACGATLPISTRVAGIPVLEDESVQPGTFVLGSVEHGSKTFDIDPDAEQPWTLSRDVADLPFDPDARLSMTVVAPTKQRAGDQVLPTGDESVEDDQARLIQFITERRQVGIERYGQGHRPFNGRSTVLDLLEELVDGAVYATALVRTREATRAEVRAAIVKGLEGFEVRFEDTPVAPEFLADQLSDRLADWAVLMAVAMSDG